MYRRPDEREQKDLRSGLRRMRTVATSLLLLSVTIYVVTSLWDDAPGWVGYVRAAAEAATIGALADWFAVTALFRHPLGIPIPHTAIIRKRKDDLGRGLQSFVQTHFLTEEIVRDKVAQIGVAGRVGAWLRQPAHADRVSDEIADRIASTLRTMNDAVLIDLVEKSALPRLAEVPLSPVLGTLLDRALADGLQRRTIDVLLEQARSWLLRNPDAVHTAVIDRAPAIAPRWLNEAVAAKVYHEVVKLLEALRADPDHQMRRSADRFLEDLARRLHTDPELRAKVEDIKARALASPTASSAIERLWSSAKQVLLDLSTDEFSVPRRAGSAHLAALGIRLSEEPELAASVNRTAADLAARTVNRYRGEIAMVIGDTVASWEPVEASRRIELQVGRDLQFIRINGTVVGAIAGLLIHLVTTLAL